MERCGKKVSKTDTSQGLGKIARQSQTRTIRGKTGSKSGGDRDKPRVG